MKKINCLFVLFIIMSCILFFSGCELLQSGLSSTLNAKLEDATGKIQLIDNVWYYNGLASENVSDEYYTQSLKIVFGKKAAIGESGITGSMIVSYTGNDDNIVSKTFSDFSGCFSSDCEAYYIDMSEILKLFDGNIIPSGTANLELKIGGFVCAEGDQKGRTIAALNKKLSIQPLFNTKIVEFSTCWYVHGKSSVALPVNGNIKLICPPSEYTIVPASTNGNAYTFKVDVNQNEILFTPTVDIKGTDGVTLTFNLPGILPEVCGHEFSQKININLVESAVVIDGKEDDNFNYTDRAVVFSDEESDQSAFDNPDYALSMGDLSKLSIVNDDDYLYIGVSGALRVNWNDGIVLMICVNSDSNNDATYSSYKSADTVSYWGGRPNVYLYHQPGFENSGSGKMECYTGAAKTNISSFVKCSPYGWTTTSNGEFTEYAIPLAQAGINKNDNISVICALTLDWSEGRASCDVIPDSSIRTAKNGNTIMTFNFNTAAKFIVK